MCWAWGCLVNTVPSDPHRRRGLVVAAIAAQAGPGGRIPAAGATFGRARCQLALLRMPIYVSSELAGVAAVSNLELVAVHGEHGCWSRRVWAERLAQEVDAAALPATAEHLAYRLLEPGVGVGDDELPAVRRRSTRPRRKLRQKPPSRTPATSSPITSGEPDSCTSQTSTRHLRTTRPESRTFSTLASSHRYG
jgi:hypothetical protein